MRTFIEKIKLVVKFRETRDFNGPILLKSHLLRFIMFSIFNLNHFAKKRRRMCSVISFVK